MRLLHVLPLVIALVATPNAAETGEYEHAAAIDAVFAEWDKRDSPGCVVGVFRDGKIVHAKGFGMADLEHDVPITPETVRANRRFPTRVADAYGAELADRIARVLIRPPIGLPPVIPRGSDTEVRAAQIWAEALAAGREQQWAAPLVVPPDRLAVLANGLSEDGWRAGFWSPRDALRT